MRPCVHGNLQVAYGHDAGERIARRISSDYRLLVRAAFSDRPGSAHPPNIIHRPLRRRRRGDMR
jgi:hypothetical protein